ncbi:acyl-CoA thioesterase [Roseofilum casamattae]|uniref:Thioesterase family protein n=1 Tax=Roseofilum casamattae BLCC-M143 TaxID=3022442 RepID=A0ABT7BWU6_9CYAN|nr:thioesterase family protein [Roseofilum casamattae]MDJ1183673.1 thioesterase family protein [Roseofilum casamattae BLCC-M143]
MAFIYTRIVRFDDTDAAGVVYFANLFRFCHEAYEASLAAAGVEIGEFFGRSPMACPIIETQGKFYHPMTVGDRLEISLNPEQLKLDEYQITYTVAIGDRAVAEATTRHVCIDTELRHRKDLPSFLLDWLRAP